MTDTTFFGGLKVTNVMLTLSDPQESNRLGDGSVLKASLGAALWAGEASLPSGPHHLQAEAEVRLARLMRAGETLLAYDPRSNGPAADPGGVVLGTSTPTIHTLDADNRRMRLTGLPVGYQLSVGDWIGWTYGSSPTRYAAHRIETAAVADAAGLTPLFAVEPFIRPGVTTGTAVTLVRPPFKAVVTSANYGAGRARVSQGPSFSFIQTLR